MKIKGGFDYITIDFENGYVMKVFGELMPKARFVVYKSSMKKWQPPHEDESVTKEVVDDIIKQVLATVTENTVQIEFV